MQSVRIQAPLLGRCIHLSRALFAGFLLAHSTSSVLASGCGDMSDLALDVWGQYKKAALAVGCASPTRDVALKFLTCGATKIQTGLAEGMVGWWNATAQNRWATIGARSLGPEWQEGQLIVGSGRRFTTLAPAYSTTRIQIHDVEGGKTNVTICGFDESGRTVVQRDVEVDPDDKRNWSFDVSNAAGNVLVVKLDAKSANRFQYRIRTDTDPIEWDYPATGFADLHVHQAAELGTAGLSYWGSHTGPAKDALQACRKVNVGDDVLRVFTGKESQGLHALPFDYQNKTLGNYRHGNGQPDFTSWPHFTDIGHQQVHADWLKQAHEGGLNLIVVSAVNNEPQCRLLRLIYPQRNPERSCEDMDNVRRQVAAFVEFDREHDWYEIAVHPWHARKIIHEGKLAVVVSLEASNLFPRSEGDFTNQLNDLYGMGVRAMQPVHETDSRFAGAAPHRDAFEIMQAVKWPGKLAGEIIDGRIGAFNRTCDGKNCVGMGPDGARLTDAMVSRRMLIDAAHMSERAFKDYHDYLMEKFRGYPIYNSHARFRRLLDAEDKDILEEFVITDEQIEMYRALGGMVGLRTGFEHICDAPDRSRPDQASINCKGKPGAGDPRPAVANNCPGSSRSIAQMVDYADQRGVSVAIGSDLNGNTYQASPRFGLEACYANRMLNKGYVEPQGEPPQGVSRGYGERGLAHVGFLPDFVADLRALNTPGVARIDNSAETFIQMWERAYGVKVADATNETACREDRDCVNGWYCSTGLTGIEPNKCKAKLEDGQRCLSERQCSSGACDASICFTPASVGIDGRCLVNAQCRTGRCSSLDGITAGKCVCMQDSDCTSGSYCNVGVDVGIADIGKNACKPKLANGALCTKDHQCSAGRCKTGFCSAEASVAMGGECRFDDECRAGQCSAPIGGATKGKCVCSDDDHCGQGRYCNKGVGGIGTNVCKDKLAKGKACTKDHQCISDRCFITCK